MDQPKSEQNISASLKGRLKRFDVAFILIFGVLYFWFAFWTVPDYGLTWDEAWENYYGDKTLNYLVSFRPEHLDMTQDSVDVHRMPDHPNFHNISTMFKDSDVVTQPHLIWPFGPTVSSFCKYVFYKWTGVFDPIDAHHMAPVLASVLLLVCLYVFVLKVFGQWQAVVATMVLALYPRWWAHAHFNPKDMVSAVAFSLVIIVTYVAVVRRCWITMLASSALWGLALAAKANALFLPLILGPWFLIVMWQRKRNGEDLLGTKTWVALGLYPVVGFLVMLLAWPLLWLDFPTSLNLYIQSLFERGQGEGGWNLIPLRYAFATMPIIVLILATWGVTAIALMWKKKFNPTHILVALWAGIPVLRVCIPGARDFDGIRHWLEFVPAVAVVAGIGGGHLLKGIAAWLEAKGSSKKAIIAANLILVAVVFAPVSAWMIQAHPNQLVYFSPLVDRLGGAQKKGYPEATDYWGSAYQQGVDWLNENKSSERPILLVGVAEHVVFYTHQIRLDRNIKLLSINDASSALMTAPPRPVYLMYITRPEWYHALVKQVDGKTEPEFEIVVDGGTILKIVRLR